MAPVDLKVALLAAAVLALLGWYALHVISRFRSGAEDFRRLRFRENFALAFDDAVPFWLRMVRAILVVLIFAGAAILISRKFGFTIYGLG
jgi:hypothetical protein